MIELTIHMVLFSKARPRVTSRGAFMPKEYQAKRKEMLRQIQEQYQGPPMEGPIRLEIDVFGEGRADADNIIGALMDAANKVLWVDDRVSIIPEIQVKWTKAQRGNSKWVIRIYPLDSGQEPLF
jgi:Holliday junction resolvase RusA-like endonuclease